MSTKYKVVCGFNGSVYSRHRSQEAAEKSAEKVKRSLNHPNCGSLASYVQIVNINARFTNIIPWPNSFGCLSVSQKRWVD
jgi:hypothetical protein